MNWALVSFLSLRVLLLSKTLLRLYLKYEILKQCNPEDGLVARKLGFLDKAGWWVIKSKMDSSYYSNNIWLLNTKTKADILTVLYVLHILFTFTEGPYVTPHQRSLQLKWGIMNGQVTSFLIEIRNKTAVTQFTLSNTTLEYDLTNLKPYTEYSIRLNVSFTNKPNLMSNWINVTTKSAGIMIELIYIAHFSIYTYFKKGWPPIYWILHTKTAMHHGTYMKKHFTLNYPEISRQTRNFPPNQSWDYQNLSFARVLMRLIVSNDALWSWFAVFSMQYSNKSEDNLFWNRYTHVQGFFPMRHEWLVWNDWHEV